MFKTNKSYTSILNKLLLKLLVNHNLRYFLMNELYVLLGGNLGNREQNLAQAIKLLEERVGEINGCSSLYETDAWGKTDQPDFLNQAVKINPFKDNAHEILADILQIEHELGRERFERWGERLIDIDILLLGQSVINTQRLTIPHPELQNRLFALIPLNEIAASVIHPVYQKTIATLLEECPDKLEVHKIIQ
ncbi:Bifunctional folate synthesis protein [compost metagenome]